MAASAITPVTVLTGFLGSGKTTLLKRMVADPRFADTALVINEWGEVAIDHELLREASEVVVAMPSGCLCCRVAGELVRTLRELHVLRTAGEVPPFKRVVIETTGLADPAPIATTLIELPLTAARFALSGFITTVDAQHGMDTLDAHPEALKQVAIADRLVVTKCDIVAIERVERLENRLRALAPGARIVRSHQGDADPARLMDMGLYRGEGVKMDAAGWLGAGKYRIAGHGRVAPHDVRIDSFVWSAPEPLAWHDVETALATICELRGERLLRMKGLVNVAGEPGPRAVHAVQHTLYPSARLREWPGDVRATQLVFIGRDLEESAVTPILEAFRSPA